jgi:putative membrane protein
VSRLNEQIDRDQRRRSRATALALAVMMLSVWPAGALAHGGPPPVPESIWRTWNFDPVILASLFAGIWAYSRGVRAIWARAGHDRGVRYWQVAAAAGGFLTIAVALVSPLDPLSSALFSAHMAQHMLLIVVAPPLLILANVSVPMIWSIPQNWRRSSSRFWHRSRRLNGVWRAIARPLPVLIIHAIVLWAWHLPSLYNAAVRVEVIHVLEHTTLFGTAFLFWWLVIQRGRQAGFNYGVGLLMVFGMVIQKTALGALITFGSSPLYSEHATTTAAWGLTQVEDQQLAGAIMMGPGGFAYLIAGVVIFAWWIRAIERSVDRDERIAAGHAGSGAGHQHRSKETV